MAAIARACSAGEIDAHIACVIADRADAAGIAIAGELGLATRLVSGDSPLDFEDRLAAAIDDSRADYVILAGFMRILSARFVARYAGRILNIHPSLLPAYRGLHTHRRVLAAGESRHGASVHFVTAELDGGPVVLQACVPVRPNDTPESLAERVLDAEHVIYPRVIGWLAEGRLLWHPEGPRLDGRLMREPIREDFDTA
jgi:phosphoribosylglycinamide formyltransferase 1